MVTQAAYGLLIGLVVVERIFELVLSNKNAKWAFSRGGVEYGRGHYGFMTVLHTAFLIACIVEVTALDRPFVPLLGLVALSLVFGAQFLRYWAIRTLGPLWNTRVIVVPGDHAVTHGPYRYVRHPNYLAVIIEGVALPLVHSAYVTAAVFSLLNAVLLMVRIRCEERALGKHCAYGEKFAGHNRFLPSGGGGRNA